MWFGRGHTVLDRFRRRLVVRWIASALLENDSPRALVRTTESAAWRPEGERPGRMGTPQIFTTSRTRVQGAEHYTVLAATMARALWHQAPLSAEHAHLILDCLGLEGHRLARACLRETQDPGPARAAASLAILGQAGPDVQAAAHRLLHDPKAPGGLRVTSLQVLGATAHRDARRLQRQQTDLPPGLAQAVGDLGRRPRGPLQQPGWLLDHRWRW